jgi:hypothetical protein
MLYHTDHTTRSTNVATTVNKSSAQSAGSSSASAKSTNLYSGWKTYSSSDNTYTIRYPSNWVSASCSTNNTCSLTGEVDNNLSPSPNPQWQVVELSHNKTSVSPQASFDVRENIPNPFDCIYDASSYSINGYSGYFAEGYTSLVAHKCPNAPTAGTTISGASSNTGYAEYYTLVHKGQAVLISMQIQDGSSGTENTVPLIPTFNEIVRSIKFNN